MHSYFIRLMEEWERIERLSVVIFGKQIPDDIQRHFLSRAPILKLFDVSLPDVPELLFLNTLQSNISQSLFADYAPSLRVIDAEGVAFKWNSPWLSNIRELYPIPNTFKENFLLLKCTPVLESIGISTTRKTWNGPLPPFSKPSLPNVSSIKLYATLAVVTRILDYISPGTLSILYITVDDTSLALNNNYILSSFKQNMPFYISSYFTSKPLSPFLLMITNGELRFCDAFQSSDYGQNLDIHIRTSFSDQKDGDDVVACLLDTFSLSPTLSRNLSLYKSVTELTLALDSVQPILFQKLYSMFAVSKHVQTIETHERSGQALWTISCLDEDSEHQKPILFPELCTLRLCSLLIDCNIEVPTGITSFLMKRKKFGFPVAKLDLTDYTQSFYPMDLRALVNVLEVVWKKTRHDSGDDNKISSYRCGSGDPEQLKGIF